MLELTAGLHIGAGHDFDTVQHNPSWFVISAAKEPWHRDALGYTGRGAPKDDPEYLAAYRPRHMIMNLVDPNDAKWIPRELINAALDEIGTKLDDGFEVLVHCNKGESRAPTIGLLYLLSIGEIGASCENGDEVMDVFKCDYYPDYNPSEGFIQFVRENWQSYMPKEE
jgi:protein-tyrosine phosphatase